MLFQVLKFRNRFQNRIRNRFGIDLEWIQYAFNLHVRLRWFNCCGNCICQCRPFFVLSGSSPRYVALGASRDPIVSTFCPDNTSLCVKVHSSLISCPED